VGLEKRDCCELPRTIHTIGHSTRPLETFLELLRDHGIGLVVDVRRWPSSKRFPHFAGETLAASLRGNEIHYLWRGDLGGYRTPSPESPNVAWRVEAFRAYADFMMTDAFQKIMDELQPLANQQRGAIMCAEAVPWRCHRQLLADAFLVRGWSVRHILDDRCEEHHLPPFARPEGAKILYSVG
jgi:uncharacterized protein (DUF488 family)